ncbi:hypothetical protein SEUCBS139899_000289 [Sporothrix eucalyptigena]
MSIKDRWNRFVRRSGSSTSTMDSSVSNGAGGNFLSKTFSWRSSKVSTSTAATSTASSYSDRGLGSSGNGAKPNGPVNTLPGVVTSYNTFGSTIDCPTSGQSKMCNNMPTLDDSNDRDVPADTGMRHSDMTESQRHQARLNAYILKFGATQPRRLSLEEISPCNTRRPSLEMSP